MGSKCTCSRVRRVSSRRVVGGVHECDLAREDPVAYPADRPIIRSTVTDSNADEDEDALLVHHTAPHRAKLRHTMPRRRSHQLDGLRYLRLEV